MQYAIQTRDYNNDYLWSWEARGRDNPLAQVSLELLRLIQDGEKGVAVVYKSGKFHVIFSAIDTLGVEPLSKDFSGACIRLNIVFADLSQEQAKGLVRYYIANRINPGIKFQGIVSWNTNSWKINENAIQEAFQRIPPVSITGKKLICQGGNENPVDWFDYDLSDETEGAKLVMQGDRLRFAADPIPKSAPIIAPHTKESRKKTGISFFSVVFVLAIVAINVGVVYMLLLPLQKKCDYLDSSNASLRTEIKTAVEANQENVAAVNTANQAKKEAEEKLNTANQAKKEAEEKLITANQAKKDAEEKLKTANQAIKDAEGKFKSAELTLKELAEYKVFVNGIKETEIGGSFQGVIPGTSETYKLSRLQPDNASPK